MQEASYERGLYYDLVYIETINRILVWKEFRLKYQINVIHHKNGGLTLVCNCPGGRWRQTCQHEDASRMFFNFNKTVKPKNMLDEIIEEYIINWITFKQGGYNNCR